MIAVQPAVVFLCDIYEAYLLAYTVNSTARLLYFASENAEQRISESRVMRDLFVKAAAAGER